MRYLCDSNVFLALTVGQHLHHLRALAWFSALGENDRAEFCRSTKLSFLRLLTQKIAPDYVPLTNRRAWETFDLLMEDDATGYAAEPEGLDEVWRRIADLEASPPKVWMDAYLASFAITARMGLVSMDKDFKNYERHGLDLLLLSE